MKKVFFTIAIVTLLATMVSCGSKTAKGGDSDSTVVADSATVAQIDAEDTDYVPQRSDYSFRSELRTITEDDEVRWDSIIVYLTDAKGHTQELYSQALPLDTLQWNKGSIGEILQDDWNFDGIPDPQFDAEAKTISTVYRADYEYVDSYTFTWDGDKLKEVDGKHEPISMDGEDE